MLHLLSITEFEDNRYRYTSTSFDSVNDSMISLLHEHEDQ